ncbi:MAG: hypothetical protein ACRDQ0_23515, partial [Pseudonocardia sp.]
MESSISLSGRGLRSRVVLVGVVDEHDIFRRGIVACLGNDAGLQVVYDARTGPVPVPVDVTVASPRAVTRLTGPSPVLVCSDARALPYRPRDGGGRPTGRGGHRSGTAVTAPPSPRFAAQPAVGPYGHLAPLYDELLGDRFFGELRRTVEWLVG